MELEQYRAQALRSEKPLMAVVTDAELCLETLKMAEAAGTVVDLLKKSAVYGKPIDYWVYALALAEVADCALRARSICHTPTHPEMLQTVPINPRIFHAAVGVFGESGELIAALLHQAHTGELDLRNVEEEGGDACWYLLAVLVDEVMKQGGGDGATMLRMNVAKLQARFPALFTLEASEAREVKSEYAAMEDARAEA